MGETQCFHSCYFSSGRRISQASTTSSVSGTDEELVLDRLVKVILAQISRIQSKSFPRVQPLERLGDTLGQVIGGGGF